MIRRPALFCFILVSLFAVASRAQQKPTSVVIVNAQLADGTGAPLRKANLRISGSRIATIGNFKPTKSDQVLDFRVISISDRCSDQYICLPAVAVQQHLKCCEQQHEHSYFFTIAERPELVSQVSVKSD